MTYPNKSVLAGAGPDDAWFIIHGNSGILLVSTSGVSVIQGIQRQLLTIIDAAPNEHFGSPAEWRLQLGGWDGGNWQAQNGRWSAATARATMTIADAWSASQGKLLRYGWRDYYSHRWGLSLTQLAIDLWLTESGLTAQLQAAEGENTDVYSAIITNETILPRWDFRPRGTSSPVTVRLLGEREVNRDIVTEFSAPNE